jgi:predicted Zn-dependent protease with MMP-like domain
MDQEQFGYLLEEVLKGLPERAAAFLKNVVITVDERPPGPPMREADVLGQPRERNTQFTNYWRAPDPRSAGLPGSMITLYREPILARGGDTSVEIEDVLLRALEWKQGLSAGELSVPVTEAETEPWQRGQDAPDELVGDPLGPDLNDRLVEVAETEMELLSTSARDWLDEVEIVAVDGPEAEGDPARLADFPVAGDEPQVFVLYAKNIMKAGDPPDVVIRGLLKEAATRAGAL